MGIICLLTPVSVIGLIIFFLPSITNFPFLIDFDEILT